MKAPTKVAEATPVKSLYQLTRPYWDGRRAHATGDKLYFAPGQQPSTAKLVEPEAYVAPALAEETDDEE